MHELKNRWIRLEDEQRGILYLNCILDYTAQEIADDFSVLPHIDEGEQAITIVTQGYCVTLWIESDIVRALVKE